MKTSAWTSVPSGAQQLMRALPVLLIAVAVALRCWQYFADTSLWYDELSIALNLRDRTLGQLVLEPLDYDQIAPVGFLLLVKICTLLFGSSDLSLRALPLLAGLAAIIVFWRVAARVLTGPAVAVAVALFALALPLVRWSTEVKQYSIDVLVALALTALALDLRASAPSRRRCIWTGLAGLLLVWFSQAAVLVLAGLGGALVLCWFYDRDRRERGPIAITVPLWALASVAALGESLRHARPVTLAYMQAFWRGREAFFPWPMKGAADLAWLWERITGFFTLPGMLGYPGPQLFSLLALAGIVVIWRSRRDVALILTGPFLVTLAAAVAQRYPFRQRTVLFLVPVVLLSLAAAIGWLGARAARAHRAFGPLVLIGLLAPALLAIWKEPPPYDVEPYKRVLKFVQTNRQAGDSVYVFAGAFQAMEHYGPRFGLPAGSWVAGTCDEGSLRAYLADLDRFRGLSRVWVIGAAVPSFKSPKRALSRYLETIGVRRENLVARSSPPMEPVSAELFDLSSANRPGATTAAAFPDGPMEGPIPIRCNERVGFQRQARGAH